MLSFSPRDVLDEIWNLIESVSEGFPTTFALLIDGTAKFPCHLLECRSKGGGLVDRKLVEAPSNFIAGRPKVALLLVLWWF